ncbi:MAG: DUF4194 domain-containing protein [Gammaproteobacteria bacterium]
MNQDEVLNELPEESPDDDSQVKPEALYPGDTGALPEDARRVLVQLLSGPSIDGKRHSKLWPALLRYQDVLRSRLADLFLELIVDQDLEVAFTRQADTGELDAPRLLRRSTMTFLDSALMLYLRQLLTDADVQGQRAVVSAEEITEQLKLYEKSQSTDAAGFEKRINAAIEKARKNSILNAIRGSENRYEISPTLKLLFSAEEIAALIKVYEQYQMVDTDQSPASEDVD